MVTRIKCQDYKDYFLKILDSLSEFAREFGVDIEYYVRTIPAVSAGDLQIDPYTCTREEMRKMKLSTLRKLGHEVGVKSPTSIRKENLIDEIYAVIHGDKTPAPYVRCGRPRLL